MKKLLFTVILCLSTRGFSQEIFYYSSDGTRFLFTETGILYAKYKNNVSDSKKEVITLQLDNNNISIDYFDEFNIIKIYNRENTPINKKTLYSLIANDSVFEFVSNELIYSGDGTIQFVNNSFFVSVKPAISIEELLDSLNVPYISYYQINPYNEKEYYVSFNSNSNDAFYYSNLIFESDLVYYAQPCFYRFIKLNNGNYNDQWGLNNTGQYGGTYGIDINVEPAWLISSGSGIKVAVLDNGVQLDHPDLSNNLIQGYDAIGGTSNGSSSENYDHGTCCAGIIAAADNSIGVKGIAYNAKIIPIKLFVASGYDLYLHNDSNIVGSFNYALANGADIISCSWGGGSGTSALDNAIHNALTYGRNGKGCVVVFASGNLNQGYVNYPSSLSGVISVGAISQCGERKSPDSCDGEVDWLGSNYGEGLSVVAPGVKIATTTLTTRGTYKTSFNGTSSAAPHVAGVAALMLSVNPHLTRQEVKDIIEQTAQKLTGYRYTDTIGYNNGTWNKYTGYGLIDALAAVSRAKNLDYDLYTRDNVQDDGREPLNYPQAGISDSPDIWVRNQNDNIEDHQPIFHGINYLYAHIHNQGSDTSFYKTDSIRFFYKPTFLTFHNNPALWPQLAVAPIPKIPSGHDTIISIPFSISSMYSGLDYAIYSRIESPFDPLHTPENTSYDYNVIQNNNISLKNVLFSNVARCSGKYGLYATFNINAPSSNNIETSNLRINLLDNDLSILGNAEVTLVFPEDLMVDWSPSSSSLKQINNNTFLITTETVDLYGIPKSDIIMRYNFFTRVNQSFNIYKNHIFQYIVNGDNEEEIMGVLTVQVEKPERATTDFFTANAGNDTNVLYGTTATLHATQIGENATYRWYDLDRNLKHEGVDYCIIPYQSAEYILEVTAETDGYRDLDTVKVSVLPGCINYTNPNPATDYITVAYEYSSMVNSAQIAIYNSATGIQVASYTLIYPKSSLDINITDFISGNYTIVLICDGVVADSKNLIKQ